MVTSYGRQVAQANEKSPLESFLDLTLIQHPRDEEFELQEVCARLKVEPFRTWYYHISPTFCTLMILLQVNTVFGDEFEIVCEGYYRTKNISIFSWSSV